MDTMLNLHDSGWRFRMFQLFDVRFVEATPTNMLRYGAVSTKKLQYNPLLKPLFHRQLFDPKQYLRPGFSQNNLCVLAGMLISCHSRLGPPLGKLTKAEMEKELDHINTTGLLPLDQRGISVTHFQKLERLNSPIPKGLIEKFSSLSYFKGFAINLFRVRKSGNIFRIFPTSLSVHNRDNSYFQCDLLEVSSDLLAQSQPDENDPSHVLSIPHLNKLITKFTSAKSNWSKYLHLCRSCTGVFSTMPALKKHYLTCPIDGRRSSTLPRKKSLNMYLHRPYILNRFSGKVEVNSLKWKSKNSIFTVRPLVLGFADYESFGQNVSKEKPSLFEKRPSKASKIQTSMSWAYCFRSLYEDVPLPKCLQLPRIKFCSYTNDSTEPSLYIAFLLSLRADLERIDQFLQDTLKKDPGAPAMKLRNPQVVAYIKSKPNCDICGRFFGQKYFSAISKTHYRLQRCYDHCHYTNSFPSTSATANLRAVTCMVMT